MFPWSITFSEIEKEQSKMLKFNEKKEKIMLIYIINISLLMV